MEFDKLLETRRSVRAFDDTKKVSESQIRELVEAGIQLLRGKIHRQPDITVY